MKRQEKNATINASLKSLLEVMDARANINLFIVEKGDHILEERLVAECKVYNLLDNTDLIGKYEVVGLCCGLVTSILIKEA